MNVTERMRVQFRAEFFNILNRANFGTPNTVVYTSATSGPVSDRGRDHVHLHHVATDPVRSQITVVSITCRLSGY